VTQRRTRRRLGFEAGSECLQDSDERLDGLRRTLDRFERAGYVFPSLAAGKRAE
jgi:hypothetical protein